LQPRQVTLEETTPVIARRNLDALIAEGHRYEYHVDPQTGHFHGEPAHRRVIAWFEKRIGI
jgi:hypothetical protein